MISLNYILYNTSFDYTTKDENESLIEVICRFNDFLEELEKERKTIQSTGGFFSTEIEPGLTLLDWLLEGEEIEKQLFRIIIEQLPTIEEWKYKYILDTLSGLNDNSNNTLICFFKCDNGFKKDFQLTYTRKEITENSRKNYKDNLYNICLRDKKDVQLAKKYYLHNIKSISSFLKEIPHCFENITLGIDVETNMNQVYTDTQFIKNHIDKIIFHLKILEEYSLIIIEEFKNRGEKVICERIKIKGHLEGFFDDCSPEGNAEKVKRLNLPFINDQGDIINIRCSPHIKYYYSNEHYRTYFAMPIDNIANGKKNTDRFYWKASIIYFGEKMPMIFELLGPAMFASLLILIFLGYPVAFSLGGVGILFGLLATSLDYFNLNLFMAFPERIFGLMSNYILLAIPFFIFMGIILEKSKIAEDLLTTIGLLFGPFRGGLGIAVILVGTLLAAATGVVGASVIAMGMISLPVMLKYGYSKSLASGIITASGTLGQIIPPSVVLIVLGDQMGVSVGSLFLGALYPGLLLSGLYIVFILVVSVLFPEKVPALPLSERNITLKELFKKCTNVMFPPLVLILLVLGSIFAGVATPTEAGALGALGAILLAIYKKRLDRANLIDSMNETSKLTVMIMYLLLGSTLFSIVFRCINGDLWVQELLTNLPGGKFSLLLITNLLIFVLGFFIDFFEIVFIIVPLIVPAAKVLNIDLVWLGVVFAINLQTSFLTPPFGFSLFYLKGIAPPELKTEDIYKGVIPFLVIQLIALVLVIFFPDIVIKSL